MAKIIRNNVEYGGGGYTKRQIDHKLSEINSDINEINTKIIGIDSSAVDYIEMENGLRLYISSTEPTGDDIPEGSVWVGGTVST
jgi:hypothetical protein